MHSAIPTIPGLPVIGNLPAFNRDRLGLYIRIHNQFGDIGAFHLGSRRVVMLYAPTYIQAVLIEHDYEHFEKSQALRRFLRPLLGAGLLTADRLVHRSQRAVVGPAFQHRNISGYADTMVAHTERLQQSWSTDMIVDINREMSRLTLGIAGTTLFGANVLDDADDLGQALTTALQHLNAQVGAFIPLPLEWPTPRNRRFKRALDRLDAAVYHMIRERRHSAAQHHDLLSMLLQMQDADTGHGLTDQQVRDEVMTFFLAGHETTANALTWTWYLLTQHPTVYAQVRDEVDRTLAGRSPTFADLPQLPYTLQVLKEALRLYPPAHAVAREVARPLELGPYYLPAGVILGISMYVLHRNPTYFPDPERFDPERFTPEAERRLPAYVYLPFSTGPRNCIGNQFAMMEGHLLLATLLQRVTFELLPGQQIVPEPLISLRPRNGIRMVVRRRAI